MRPSLLRRVVPWCGVLLAATGFCAAPAHSAPVAKGAKGKKGDAPLAKPTAAPWAALVPEYDAALERDSASALALFRRFVAEHGDLKAEEMVNAYDDAATRLFARDASQLEAALGLLDEALAMPRFAPEVLRFRLVNDQAVLLRQAKRFAEVETLLQKHWKDALQPGRWELERQQMLWHRVEVLHAQQKESEAEALMWEALGQHPLLLKWPTLRAMMQRAQEAQGRDAAALSWGKLNFALTPFGEASITKATRQLTQLWLKGDLNLSAPRAFAAAQSQADAPNPLDEVALPLWPAEVRAALTAATLRGTPENRIVALLALERSREAMEQARDELVRNPTSVKALEQVALVFKAADGDVARANAFLSYYNSGTGENPMVAFMAPPQAAAK